MAKTHRFVRTPGRRHVPVRSKVDKELLAAADEPGTQIWPVDAGDAPLYRVAGELEGAVRILACGKGDGEFGVGGVGSLADVRVEKGAL